MTNNEFVFLSIDPGRQKCGLAVMNSSCEILNRSACSSDAVYEAARDALNKFPEADRIVIGAGTGSKDIAEKLREKPEIPNRILFVPEKNTTLEALKIFDKENPFPWPIRFIPRSFLFRPHDIDSYAAVAIGRIYISSLTETK